MSHPEEFCQLCERPNIWSWFVDSDRFNLAMEAIGLDSGTIVCPQCFVEAHEKATNLVATWELRPSGNFSHISLKDLNWGKDKVVELSDWFS